MNRPRRIGKARGGSSSRGFFIVGIIAAIGLLGMISMSPTIRSISQYYQPSVVTKQFLPAGYNQLLHNDHNQSSHQQQQQQQHYHPMDSANANITEADLFYSACIWYKNNNSRYLRLSYKSLYGGWDYKTSNRSSIDAMNVATKATLSFATVSHDDSNETFHENMTNYALANNWSISDSSSSSLLPPIMYVPTSPNPAHCVQDVLFTLLPMAYRNELDGVIGINLQLPSNDYCIATISALGWFKHLYTVPQHTCLDKLWVPAFMHHRFPRGRDRGVQFKNGNGYLHNEDLPIEMIRFLQQELWRALLELPNDNDTSSSNNDVEKGREQQQQHRSRGMILFETRRGSSRRTWENADEIANIVRQRLKSQNVDIHILDDAGSLTLKEQADLYHNATVWIGPHGGSNPNWLYMRPNTTVFEITCLGGSWAREWTIDLDIRHVSILADAPSCKDHNERLLGVKPDTLVGPIMSAHANFTGQQIIVMGDDNKVIDDREVIEKSYGNSSQYEMGANATISAKVNVSDGAFTLDNCQSVPNSVDTILWGGGEGDQVHDIIGAFFIAKRLGRSFLEQDIRKSFSDGKGGIWEAVPLSNLLNYSHPVVASQIHRFECVSCPSSLWEKDITQTCMCRSRYMKQGVKSIFQACNKKHRSFDRGTKGEFNLTLIQSSLQDDESLFLRKFDPCGLQRGALHCPWLKEDLRSVGPGFFVSSYPGLKPFDGSNATCVHLRINDKYMKRVAEGLNVSTMKAVDVLDEDNFGCCYHTKKEGKCSWDAEIKQLTVLDYVRKIYAKTSKTSVPDVYFMAPPGMALLVKPLASEYGVSAYTLDDFINAKTFQGSFTHADKIQCASSSIFAGTKSSFSNSVKMMRGFRRWVWLHQYYDMAATTIDVDNELYRVDSWERPQ